MHKQIETLNEEASKVKEAQDFNKKLQDEITKLMLLAD